MGCGATYTAINKRNLDLQTKMSASIFLDPVTEDKKTLYLQLRNTSDKPLLLLERKIATAIEGKGYKVVKSLDEAHYLLQANILQVGRNDLRAAQHALNKGFGAAISGATTGAAIASLAARRPHKKQAAVLGGAIGSAVATVTDAMIQDVIYSVIADVQISERVPENLKVKAKTKSRLKQGSRSTQEITSSEEWVWKRYQTRIVCTANKVNLKFESAEPELIIGLARSITGIF